MQIMETAIDHTNRYNDPYAVDVEPLLGRQSKSVVRRSPKCCSRRCVIVVCVLILFAAAVTVLWILFSPTLQASVYGIYSHAAVASDAKQCSEIGSAILEANGSVVDAAVASLFCLGIHNMQSAGLGGGFHMVVYDTPKNGTKREAIAIDARESAPLSVTKQKFGNTTGHLVGGPSVAMPGEVLGYYEAWKRFGRLPWRRLVEPTIALCRDGFRVGWALSSSIKGMESVIRQTPTLRELLVKPDGSLYARGDLLRCPKLAATLEFIANDTGVKDMYHGSLAERIVDDLRDIGANITLSDLANYEVRVYPALEMALRSGDVMLTLRPPSSGALLGMMLRILEGFKLTDRDLHKVDTYQKIVETFKFSYAMRTYLGDEHYVNITEALSNITSMEFADYLRSRIDVARTHDVDYYDPAFPSRQVESGTSHLSILGPDGSAVAVTSTVNSVFGSQRIGTRTGILFNDEMNDFIRHNQPWPSLLTDPSPAKEPYANEVSPGKRPMSSMCPTIVVDRSGSVSMVIGASGGMRITSATAFAAAGKLWLGEAMNKAIDEPRLYHQLVPNEIDPETDFSASLLKKLQKKGHKTPATPPLGHAVVQAIYSWCHRKDGSGGSGPEAGDDVDPKGCIMAVSDRRKHGAPSGY